MNVDFDILQIVLQFINADDGLSMKEMSILILTAVLSNQQICWLDKESKDKKEILTTPLEYSNESPRIVDLCKECFKHPSPWESKNLFKNKSQLLTQNCIQLENNDFDVLSVVADYLCSNLKNCYAYLFLSEYYWDGFIMVGRTRTINEHFLGYYVSLSAHKLAQYEHVLLDIFETVAR